MLHSVARQPECFPAKFHGRPRRDQRPAVLLSLHHDDANRHPGDDANYLVTIRAWCLLKEVLFWQVKSCAGKRWSAREQTPAGRRNPTEPSGMSKERGEANYRGTGARASRLGELLPVGLRRPGVQSDGFLGEEESPSLAVSARRTAPHEALPFYWPTALGPASSAGYGALRYPAQATPRRSSLSRVPEIGMHGLKGGPMAPGRF